jgi:glutamine amidotransferase
MEKCDPPALTGWAQHGERFVASIEFENIYATQFHPEKSQSNGLMVLKNFVEI